MRPAERLQIFSDCDEIRQTFDYRLQPVEATVHSPKLLANRRKKKPAKPLGSSQKKASREQKRDSFSPKVRRNSRVFQDLLNSGNKKVVNLKELPKQHPAALPVPQLAEAETPQLACRKDQLKPKPLLEKVKKLMDLLKISEPAEATGQDEQGQSSSLLDLIIDTVQQSLSKLHQPEPEPTAPTSGFPRPCDGLSESARQRSTDLLQCISDSSIQDFDLYISQFKSRVPAPHSAGDEARNALRERDAGRLEHLRIRPQQTLDSPTPIHLRD